MLEIEAYSKMEISPEIQELLNTLIKGVLAIAIPYVIMIVQNFLAAKVAEFRAGLTTEQLTQLDYWAGLIVKSIEQSELKEGIERSAEEKLNLAIDFLQERADSIGLTGLNFEDYANLIRSKLRDGVHHGAVQAAELSECCNDNEEDNDITAGGEYYPVYRTVQLD